MIVGVTEDVIQEIFDQLIVAGADDLVQLDELDWFVKETTRRHGLSLDISEHITVAMEVLRIAFEQNFINPGEIPFGFVAWEVGRVTKLEWIESFWRAVGETLTMGMGPWLKNTEEANLYAETVIDYINALDEFRPISTGKPYSPKIFTSVIEPDELLSILPDSFIEYLFKDISITSIPSYIFTWRTTEVLQSKYVPSSVLSRLKNSNDVAIQIAVASNPNSDKQTLDELSKSESFYVRKCVAANINTGQSTLDTLSKDKNYRIRMNVARNPNTSKEVLDRLSEDEDGSVRASVAHNPNTSKELLDRLSRDKSRSVRASVAHNPNTSKELLDRLSRDKDEWVRGEVAENPNTAKEVLDRLSQKADNIVWISLARNPSLPAYILVKLSNITEDDMRPVFAGGPNKPKEFVDSLSKDQSEVLRAAVARNPNTPKEVLDKLSKDEASSVRYEVTQNPNVPKEILFRLSNDTNDGVRQAVAYCPTAPKEALDRLSQDPVWYIRRSVARNPYTPNDILDQLCQDKDQDVSISARLNPNRNLDNLIEDLSARKDNERVKFIPLILKRMVIAKDDIYTQTRIVYNLANLGKEISLLAILLNYPLNNVTLRNIYHQINDDYLRHLIKTKYPSEVTY